MTFIPNGGRLLLKDVQHPDLKNGAIIVPDAALARRFEVECEVLAVGPACQVYKAGDVVLVHVNDGRNTTLAGDSFRIFEEEKILGMVRP